MKMKMLLIGLVVCFVSIGCVKVSKGVYYPAAIAEKGKTKRIFVEKVEMFKNMSVSPWTDRIKSFGEPDPDNPLGPEIEARIKEELRKRGFVVEETPLSNPDDYQGWVIKVRAGKDPSLLGPSILSWGAGMVAVKIDVYRQNKFVFSVERNIATDVAGLDDKRRTKKIIPSLVKKLKEKIL